MNEHIIFVYGTLRANQENHHYLKGAKVMEKDCWTDGKLYDVGCGYPAMTLEHGGKVYGELYIVSDAALVHLDVLEDYQIDSPELSLYDRTTRTVHTNHQEYEALLYYFTADQAHQLREIKSGDWIEDQNSN